MKLFMAVTADEYELPLYVAERVRELAEWHGIGVDAVHQAIYRYERDANRKRQIHPGLGVRFCRVEVDDDDE